MLSHGTFIADANTCPYLGDRESQLEYEFVAQLSPAEYEERILSGWRRFGIALFHPVCATCTACWPLRVPLADFEASRSQRRALSKNEDLVVTRGAPMVSMERLELLDRYQAHQTDTLGWPSQDSRDPESYISSFILNPLPTEEWTYRLDGQLIAVGYVDILPNSYSAIYFYYNPDFRERSLGTLNVLRVLEAAKLAGREFLHLGYFVEGCRSLIYKANFNPHQLLRSGHWSAPTKA